MSADRDFPVPGSHFAADVHRAEMLLFELATELRRLPVEERTRALHVRALELKHSLGRWPEDQPDDPARRAFCDEVIALQRETRDFSAALRSVRQDSDAKRTGHRVD